MNTNTTPNHDLTTEDGVKSLMESSASESEWNSNCDAVKKTNNGYPAFWYAAIVLSGVAGKAQAKWILNS